MVAANPSWTRGKLGQRRSILCPGQEQSGGGKVAIVADSADFYTEHKTYGGVQDVVSFGNHRPAYVAILTACAKSKDLQKGHLIHINVLKMGLLKKNTYVGNTLVNLYGKRGALAKAQELFDELLVRDVCTWNLLLRGYIGNGCAKETLSCFDQMQREGIYCNGATYVSAFKACGSIGALDKGREIHAEVISENWLEKEIWVAAAIMNMYAKCNALASAQKVFNKIPVKNTIVWTALIAGYAQYGHGQQALHCFEQMQQEDISPNGVTYACILKVCGSIGAIDKGQELHTRIVRGDFLRNDVWLGIALVDMYVKCGVLERAQGAFNELPVTTAVSWTVLIAGYAQNGHSEEALNCFEHMLCKGFFPNAVTLVCVFKACGNIGAVEKGRELHRRVEKYRLLEKDVRVGTALVDMYAKCGALVAAQDVFDRLQVRNAVTWTALITGYIQCGLNEDALHCFEQMQDCNIHPDPVTFACVLRACGCLGAADKGQEIYVQIVRNGFLEKDCVLGNELLDMYAKCALPQKAQEVFEKLLSPDVFSWTALIAGYAQLGMMDVALELLNKMSDRGIEPNLATFTVILNACSHLGRLEEGEMYFEVMSTKYGMVPHLEHYTCMIDLFGRAGSFGKAMLVILTMPSSSFEPWITLLSACRKWGNLKLGRWAFEHAMQLYEKDGAAYVCMQSIYLDAGMQEDAHNIDALRVRKKAFNISGGSVGSIAYLSAFAYHHWSSAYANE